VSTANFEGHKKWEEVPPNSPRGYGPGVASALTFVVGY